MWKRCSQCWHQRGLQSRADRKALGQLESGQAVPEPQVWCHWGKAGSSERGEVRGLQEGCVTEREGGCKEKRE